MHEEPRQGSSPASPQSEPDVVALIKGLQQQLVFLEKKIDILINQPQGAPRSFDRSHRPDKRNFDSRPGERGPAQGRGFEKRHGDENRGFGYKKKAYDNPREESRGKKPFYYRGKGRG